MRETSHLVIPMGTMHAEASLLAFTASMLTTWSVTAEHRKERRGEKKRRKEKGRENRREKERKRKNKKDDRREMKT